MKLLPAKIDICPIVADHIGTLKTGRNANKPSFCDLSLFYGFPVAIAIALVALNVRMPDKYVDFFLIFSTIVIPMIVNVLFLIYNIKERSHSTPATDPTAERLKKQSDRLLSEIFKNLSYAIIVSVAIVLSLWITRVLSHLPESVEPIVSRVFYFAVYASLIHFGLTALMIVKRTHTLLGNEFPDPTEMRKTIGNIPK